MPPLPPISRNTRFGRDGVGGGGRIYPFGGQQEDEAISPSELMVGRLTLAVMIYMIARCLNVI
jgi:hypothetical protein